MKMTLTPEELKEFNDADEKLIFYVTKINGNNEGRMIASESMELLKATLVIMLQKNPFFLNDLQTCIDCAKFLNEEKP
jgi:hypothetical protein